MNYTDSIGITYNFYQNQKIELRVSDNIFIETNDLISFYVSNEDEVFKIDEIKIIDNSLNIKVSSFDELIKTDSTNIVDIWNKLFLNKIPFEISRNDTFFDLLITKNNVEKFRIYEKINVDDYKFIDFSFSVSDSIIQTYKPFQKRKLKSVEFQNQNINLILNNNEILKIDFSVSPLLSEIILDNFKVN